MHGTKLNILMTGVTGYIGGTVLAHFLAHPDFSSFNITVLVRSQEKAESLKEFGVHPVVGSHSNEELMARLASENDVVMSMADSDNHEAAVATLKGLRKRYDKTGLVPVVLHTSGTSTFNDDAKGLHWTDTIYDDMDPDQIETLPITQWHRNVDLEFVQADQEGYLRSYIVVPSTIWGIVDNALVRKGIQNPHSIQMPLLIRACLDRGQGGIIGEGKNTWPDVNIDELADLYVLLFNAIRNNANIGHGREGYYFGENGEHRLYDVSKAIAEALVAIGKADNPVPSTFTQQDIQKYPLTEHLGGNSRCRGNRSRALGWRPVKTSEDFIASLRPEVEALVKTEARPPPPLPLVA